ncbi:hypothetical protein [Desulfatitalea alkaliphila]|uniref:Uncharacterized protein n=1 Tax=Desulfatitalea alkaliphila TaxID=2929485 RepID=A0AA41UIQ8_9BACT|nr:hypothetical protein [Desulfatitalea alkaliphila]MCJ8501030.1 hypothetical protein [Desulfatitalea alkaliphila]
MARITIDCADPNDFAQIVEKAEQAAGRCNVTYAKQAAALVEAGTVRSERAAAQQIAEETGEPVNTVRAMIQRGKSEVDATASKMEWPKCKKCKTEDVSHASLHRPAKDRLCSECRREVAAEKLKAAQEAFEAVPVDAESDAFWRHFVSSAQALLDAGTPLTKVAPQTWSEVYDLHTTLGKYLGFLAEQSQPPGT